MFATGRVSGDPDIKFIITGTDEVSFVPQDENRLACSANGNSATPCFIGFKPIVVAGGQVLVRGLPSTCATWVHLEDIVSESISSPRLPQATVLADDPACSMLSSSLMTENFASDENAYLWTGGLGARFQVTDEGTFKVTERKSATEHGPTWDMVWIRKFLVPGQTYLFSARIKLNTEGAARGDWTNCAYRGENCLSLHSISRAQSRNIGRSLGAWEQKQQIRYDNWFDFYTTFSYTEEELDEENIYQILQLRGPEAGVDIEIDHVSFSLPDPAVLPDKYEACVGNLILNGDAEFHAINPFPFTSSGGILAVGQESNGNRFFRQTERSSDHHSLLYFFPVFECLITNGKYSLSASLRMRSDKTETVKIELRTMYESGTVVVRSITECQVLGYQTWNTCKVNFTLDPELAATSMRDIRLQFETIGAANLDMDIDNLELSALEGSVSKIKVPATGVEECWGKGSEILITSHTLDYEDGQIRTLVADPSPTGDGFVLLDLDDSIVSATTRVQNPDFAVEVALLSRNILFVGEEDKRDDLFGAHFMILQTPTVKQFMDGVEFSNFGQQGVLGRYVSHPAPHVHISLPFLTVHFS